MLDLRDDPAGKEHQRCGASAEHRQANATTLAKKWTEEQSEIAKNVTTRKPPSTQKPATIQPGAPNDVHRCRERSTRLGNGRQENTRSPKFTRSMLPTRSSTRNRLTTRRSRDRMHPIRLPATAWAKVKPNAELFLVVAEVDEKTQRAPNCKSVFGSPVRCSPRCCHHRQGRVPARRTAVLPPAHARPHHFQTAPARADSQVTNCSAPRANRRQQRVHHRHDRRRASAPRGQVAPSTHTRRPTGAWRRLRRVESCPPTCRTATTFCGSPKGSTPAVSRNLAAAGHTHRQSAKWHRRQLPQGNRFHARDHCLRPVKRPKRGRK